MGTWLGEEGGIAMVSGSCSGVCSKCCYSVLGCSGADSALA